MSTTESDAAAGAHAPATETEGAHLLKRNSDDVGWQYGILVDPNNKDKVKCKFCNKVMQGGIYRLKQHVAHDGKNATKCPKSTDEAKEKCQKCFPVHLSVVCDSNLQLLAAATLLWCVPGMDGRWLVFR